MALAMLILMFVSLVAANPLSDSPAPLTLPPFCNGLQCPAFQLLNKTEEYEVRLYPKSSWVSTDMTGADCTASSGMFMTLFRYIQGSNDQQKKIPMTCPVIKKITPGQGTTCNFTMSFFNDPAEGPAPVPTNNAVYLNEVDTVVVYVRSFGGFADYADYKNNAKKLGVALKKDGLEGTFMPDQFLTAGYDSPWKASNRHNEVWLMKTK